MGEVDPKRQQIHARIVYFGAAGAGTTTNLEYIHRKLRAEHRGDLVHSGSDPDSRYESLAVQLGRVQGYETALEIVSVPVGAGAREERRKLLARADGIVFVADLQPERHDATAAAVQELREHLENLSRPLDDLMLLIQYNKSDLADENALDSLHRRLGLEPAATFEAVAHEGTGVLPTLTTVSKLMLARLRRTAELEQSSARLRLETSGPDVEGAVEVALDTPPGSAPRAEKGFRLESAGPVEGSETELRIPIRLIDETSGRRIELCLRLGVDVA
ncbi:MAG: ATP/GTP-binding protein [Myxococcota bacterium]